MTMKCVGRFWCVIVSLAAAGCGAESIVCEPGDTRPICGDIDESQAIIVREDGIVKDVDLVNPVSHTICYRAIARTRGGGRVDVTNTVTWTIDRWNMGTFAGPCLNTAVPLKEGGIVKVGARLNAAYGEVSLILRLHGSAELDGVGPGSFAGSASTDPGAKPDVVYPLNDSIHANNIVQMNVQFHSGAGNQVFRARFTSSHLDYTMFFRPTKCDADRCQWTVPEKEWERIARTNAGTATHLILSGASGAGGAVAQADRVVLTFSPKEVTGGLYYFSTSLWGIMRLPFGETGAAKKATPFIIPQTASNPITFNNGKGGCAGCHAVTFGGEKITATYGHGDDYLGIAAGEDATDFSMRPVADGTRSNFQSFGPESQKDARDWKLISNFDSQLILRDGNTGAEITRVAKSSIDPENKGRDRAVMPEWSHNGSDIVFVRLPPQAKTFYDAQTKFAKRPGGDWLITDAGEITVIPYNGGQFGPARVVVSLGEGNDFHYYPTWSPDDQWIIFNSGTKPGFSPVAQDTADPLSYGVPSGQLVSYDQSTSRLRIVRASGGGVIDLVRATVAPGKTTSWPKFTPFVQNGGKLMFFTYSSKMDYGFVVTSGRQPQLWMSAVDLTRLGETQGDPSFAPAWLPFQDERENNHLGVWATDIVCKLPIDCPPQFMCDPKGKCVGCDVDRGCM